MLGTKPVGGLNLLIASPDGILRRHLRRVVVDGLGHGVAGEAATGTEMVRLGLASDADAVLFDERLPHLCGLEALLEIRRIRSCPAVALVTDGHFETAEFFLEEIAYLIKPARIERLRTALREVAVFGERRRIQEEAAQRLAQSRRDKGLIEQAKTVLMEKLALSEPEAHRRLQRISMNRRMPMIKMAREVLTHPESWQLDPSQQSSSVCKSSMKPALSYAAK